MSMIFMVAAMQAKVGNPLRKLVLLKLADNANDDGECFPSHKYICTHCEISRRSVINHINALKEQGFLTIVNRNNGNSKASNIYKLNIEAIQKAKYSAPNALGGSAGDALPSAGDALGGSAGDAHITCQYINQSNNHIGNSYELLSDADASLGDSRGEKQKRYDAPIKKIVELYNKITSGKLSSAQQITDSRKTQINARWLQMKDSKSPSGKIRYYDEQTGLAWWESFFKKVLINDTWNGNNNINFSANLDWIIKQSNFVKVLEWCPTRKQIEEMSNE